MALTKLQAQLIDNTTALTVTSVTSANATNGYDAYNASRASRSFCWGLDASGNYGIWDTTSSVNNRLIIDSSGNVGIGTNLPNYKITIGGQTGATTTPLALRFADDYSSTTSASACKLFLYNDGTTGQIYGIGIGSNADIQYHAGSTGAANGNHRWYTHDTERLRLDSSGNLGLGVTPSGTSVAWKQIALFNSSIQGRLSDGACIVGANVDSGANKYLTSNPATYYYQVSGQHQWHNAPSGTAGTSISFNQAMTLDASGRLTLPYQPSFLVYSAGFAAPAGGWGTISTYLTSTNYNVGSHFNSATGRFTAPIAGRYMFYAGGWASSNSNGERYAVSVTVNSGQQNYITGSNYCLSDSPLAGYTVTLNLSAGDYVILAAFSAVSTTWGGSTHKFYYGGYLLG